MSQVEVTEVIYKEFNLIKAFTKFLKDLNKELKTSYDSMDSLQENLEDFDERIKAFILKETKRPLKNGDVLFFEHEEDYGGPNDLFFAVEWSHNDVKHVTLFKYASDNDTIPPMYNFCNKKLKDFLYKACEGSKTVNPNQICVFQNQEHYKINDLLKLTKEELDSIYMSEKDISYLREVLEKDILHNAYFYSEGNEVSRIVHDNNKLYIENIKVKDGKLNIERSPETITFIDFV